ncbi:MAG TPA: hypothetical protein VNT79_14870 [Phycisphaerae bacterium]|nr:hypothetical protein [Phycisphaerae bacterium]
MTGKKRNRWIGFLAIFCLLLSACDEQSASGLLSSMTPSPGSLAQ